MSEADIIIEIGPNSDVEEIVYDVMQKVRRAATKSVITAGEQHIQTARDNVTRAYDDDPKISLIYAWSLIPEAVRKSQTSKQNKEMAKRISDTKSGMVVTGNLLSQISLGKLTNNYDNISVELLSKAPYSQNLEQGILFGTYRPGKERRFFTKHLHFYTIPTMISELYKNIREEE